jgi:uncharacterized protein YlxP (DUF503 family)
MAYLVALTIHLHLPDNGSLKGKRKELLAVKAALSRRFGAAVAEVDHHDLWQRSTLAAGLVGRSARELEQLADAMERYLEQRYPDGVRVERRLLSFSDLAG